MVFSRTTEASRPYHAHHKAETTGSLNGGDKNLYNVRCAQLGACVLLRTTPYMKTLLLLSALFWSCHAFAGTEMPLAAGVGGDPSLVATLVGAVTMLAGLMRFRRRR